PIIMVTAQIDRSARLAGLEAGAEEFLTKPVDRAELWVRVRNLLRLKAFSDFLKNHNALLEQEVSERTASLMRMAHYDPLTGLLNRTLFYESLRTTLGRSFGEEWMVAVLFIDIDHFKIVNDTMGHAMGDELLRQVGNRLSKCVRARDVVSRLGGDEFALLLVIRGGLQAATTATNKILRVLSEPFDLKGHEVTVTASIGVTLHPDDASDPETLLKYADTAMYQAKHAGRNTFRFFTPAMNVAALSRLELETALRRALEKSEFVLHYQPKVQLATGRICGLEALLRWERPGHGLVSPLDFIPVLEETGLIVNVGSWVIESACRQIATWRHSSVEPIQISVNVSPRQFLEGDLEGDVGRALSRHDISADHLELELTESSLMANTDRTIESLQALKQLGVQISIDDFGTGYSSLAYLRRFPIDKLKIDIAFIRDVTHNPDAAAIALTIINMAHTLKLKVIAEGVETEAQLAYLRRHGCDQIQGYYFSRPLPLTDLEQLVQDGKCLPPAEGDVSAPVKTLLLVEEDVDPMETLHEQLRDDDSSIVTITSTALAFEQLALHRVQVILWNQSGPGTRNTELFHRVKDMYPDTLQIVLSDNTDPESLIEVINHGAIYRFFVKPCEPGALRHSIREAFRHHQLTHDVPHDRRSADA
nr:EAL domain-containing protein [Pseudomonadota bacterium]